jgi:uncharacterized Zn finger protein (UPF0148 family)
MSDQIKKMADLLRSGATMLKDVCPVCNSPLFRVENKTVCAKCGYTPAVAQQVFAQPDNTVRVLNRLNLTVAKKLDELESEIAKATDLDRLSKLAELVLIFLRILHLTGESREEKPTKVE